MTIQDIINISTVYDEKSINRAAEKLYISQPALSKCIKRVEKEYDIEIFARSQGSSLTLTAEGEMFLDMARGILAEHSRFTERLEEARLKDRYRISFGLTMQRATAMSSTLMTEIYRKYPKYYLDIRTYPSKDLISALNDGIIDIAMMVNDIFPDGGIHKELLFNSANFIYLRSGSALAEQAVQVTGKRYPVLSVKALQGETIVVNTQGTSSRMQLEKLLKKNGVDVKLVEHSNHAIRMAMSDSGYATGMLPVELLWTDGDTIDKSRLFSIPDEEQVGTGRYLVCREAFAKDPRFRILSEVIHAFYEGINEMI